MLFRIQIPANAVTIIQTLQAKGYAAHVVGGCVRDSLMNRTPHDWDICTSATPKQMLEIFRDYRIIATGLKHGTVTVVIDGESYECTTYRIDGAYTDNRRPDSVTFTDDIVEDLKRRDFTINAMAYNAQSGELSDPFDGLNDLLHECIKCVGNAEDRFNEDALRILRAIRFAAQLDFIIDSETEQAVRSLYTNLQNIAVERISSELCKIVQTAKFSDMLLKYPYVFALFIPEINAMMDFPQNNPYHSYDVFMHTVRAVEQCTSDDLTVRLAVFFHDIGKPHSYQDDVDGTRHFKQHACIGADMTDVIMKRLRFDNDTRENVVQLVFYHDTTIEPSKKCVKRWLNKLGEKQLRRLLYVKRADTKGQKAVYDRARLHTFDAIESIIDEVVQEQQCFTLKDLAINGNDLLNLGYKPGKSLGVALNKLLNGVINEEYVNEHDVLLAIAKEQMLDEVVK